MFLSTSDCCQPVIWVAPLKTGGSAGFAARQVVLESALLSWSGAGSRYVPPASMIVTFRSSVRALSCAPFAEHGCQAAHWVPNPCGDAKITVGRVKAVAGAGAVVSAMAVA